MVVGERNIFQLLFYFFQSTTKEAEEGKMENGRYFGGTGFETRLHRSPFGRDKIDNRHDEEQRRCYTRAKSCDVDQGTSGVIKG